MESKQKSGPFNHYPSITLVIALACVFAIGAWARLRGLPAFSGLYDALGPYWAAIRLDGRAHAAPYGTLLLAPYFMAIHLTSCLWDAVQVTGLVHALIGVCATLASLRIWPKRLLVGVVFGLLVSLDSGLVDTAVSGAKGYYAALFVATMLWSRGPWVWVFWAFAVANHPLALAALPFALKSGSLARRNLWGLAVCVLAIGTQIAGWGSPGVSDGSDMGAVLDAIGSYIKKGGWFSMLVLTGPFVGLVSPETRGLAIRTLIALTLLTLVGCNLGYLRDHHIRIFTVPALMGWGALPGWWTLLVIAALRIPANPVFPTGMVAREGTLGLNHRITDMIEAESTPFIVDGAWLSGSPAVEPAGIMLDLYLRGWRSDRLNMQGDVVVILSAERGDIDTVEETGRTIIEGDRYRIFRAAPDAVQTWSAQLCRQDAKLGGAWDALSVIAPGTVVSEMRQWWACD